MPKKNWHEASKHLQDIWYVQYNLYVHYIGSLNLYINLELKNGKTVVIGRAK